MADSNSNGADFQDVERDLAAAADSLYSAADRVEKDLPILATALSLVASWFGGINFARSHLPDFEAVVVLDLESATDTAVAQFECSSEIETGGGVEGE